MLYEHLTSLLEAQKAAGGEVAVELQDYSPEIDWLHSVTLSRDGGRVTISYGRGIRRTGSTSFTDGERRTFRYTQRGFFGYDYDGEWVKLRGTVRIESPGRLRRDVVRSGPWGGAGPEAASDRGAGEALVDAAVARALVFNAAPLGRSTDPGGSWQIQTGIGGARSAQPRMWQDHRCVLEYLVSEAVKHGRGLLVPGVKIMTAMNMRFTKGSVKFGKAALQRMRDTVVEVTNGDGSGCATWRELRLIERVEWRDDGGVEVTLTPEAIGTFPPANSAALRTSLAQLDQDWWESWMAGFATTDRAVTISRQDLELLAGACNDEKGALWSRLVEVPDDDLLDAECVWFDSKLLDAGYEFRRGRWGDPRRSRGDNRSLSTLAAELDAQRKRVRARLDGGGFVTGRTESVCWRRIGTEQLEIVCFEKSGLERRAR